jgi:DNA-binding response OmpR family regulator
VLYLTTGEADSLLLKALRELGHAVDVARVEDLSSIESPEDLDCVIADLRAPSPDLAAAMTATWPLAFHIQLATTSDPIGAANALRAGADACFARPLELREIVGRLDAAARRRSTTSAFVLEGRQLEIHGERISLTANEALIVETLARNPGQIFNVEQIGERIWGVAAAAEPSSVRAAISRLNLRALRQHGWRLIVGERGRGYRFQPHRGD